MTLPLPEALPNGFSIVFLKESGSNDLSYSQARELIAVCELAHKQLEELSRKVACKQPGFRVFCAKRFSVTSKNIRAA